MANKAPSKTVLTRQFDYYQPGVKMVSYPAGEQESDMPQTHYDAAVKAGVVKGVEQPTEGGSGNGQ